MWQPQRDTVRCSRSAPTPPPSMLAFPRPRRRLQLSPHLLFDPGVGIFESLLERHLGLPFEHLAQAGVVRVPPPHSLGSLDMPLDDLDSRQPSHHVDHVVDADQAIGSEVQRIWIIRAHELVHTGDAIVDEAEGPRLVAIAPDLDLRVPGELRVRYLPTNGRRRLLAPTLPRSLRPIDVVEADDTGLDGVVVAVVVTKALRHELLPPVSVFGLGGVGVLFLEGDDVGVRLPKDRIDASRGGIKVPLDPLLSRGFERVDVDERVVVKDPAVVGGDEAHAAHVRSEGVDLLDSLGCLEAVLPANEVEQEELIRPRGRVFGLLDVHTPDPVAQLLQVRNQVVSDEASRTADQYPHILLRAHRGDLSSQADAW